MVKAIYEITIRQYSLFEKTGKIDYLQKKPFRKDCDCSELLTEIIEGLQGDSENSVKLTKESHRMKSIYRIQMLIALYEAVFNLMVLLEDVNRWKKLIGKKETKIDNLKEYVEKIEKLTRIKIEDVKDLDLLKKEIERWTDKFNETFKEEEVKEGMTFMQIVLGTFAAMNMALDYGMYMSDFLELKKEAEKLSKKK